LRIANDVWIDPSCAFSVHDVVPVAPGDVITKSANPHGLLLAVFFSTVYPAGVAVNERADPSAVMMEQ
jgi:hypothetical protein